MMQNEVLGVRRVHLVKSRDWCTASRAIESGYKLRSRKTIINKKEFEGGIIACTQRAGILVLLLKPFLEFFRLKITNVEKALKKRHDAVRASISNDSFDCF